MTPLANPRENPQLILGSSSPYRRQLLEKLRLKFTQISPSIDESATERESAELLCRRLAKQKAHALIARHPTSVIITSDQCAAANGQILGKPLTRENAINQLIACSESTVTFYTAVCVYDGKGQLLEDIDTFEVDFRKLKKRQIEHYVDIESPLDCAGSFKSEGLGIALFKRLRGDDPNTLVGLPLIKLVDLLSKAGIDVL